MFAPSRSTLRVAMSLALVSLSVSCMSQHDERPASLTAPSIAKDVVLTTGDGIISPEVEQLFALVGRGAGFDLMPVLSAVGPDAAGRNSGFTLIGRVLSLNDKGALEDQAKDPAGAATRLAAFIRTIYTKMGYPAPTVSAAALGRGGAVQVVRAATGGTVRTLDQTAGLRFPANAMLSDALVVIEPLTGVKLPTTLPQSGPYFEFSTYPKQSFVVPVQIALRLADAPAASRDSTWTRIAHTDPLNPGLIQIQARIGCPEVAIISVGLLRMATTMSLGADVGGEDPPADDAPILEGSTERRPIRSGAGCQFSPHGAVVIYDPRFNTKQLSVVGTCSGNARIRNSSASDVVVRYAIDGTSEGGYLTIEAGNAKGRPWNEVEVKQSAKGRVRAFYGPVAINPNGDGSCG